MTWTRMRGLKIVRTKRGAGVYVYYRKTGTRLKHAPRLVGDEWRATPELLAELAELESRSGAAPAAGTVSALIVAYKTAPAFTDLGDVTQGDYAKVLDWMKGRAGNERPDGLTPARAREIRDKAAKARGYRFGRYVVQVCRVLWKFGVEYGHAKENPWASVSLPKRPRDLPDRNRPWTPQEVATVLKSAPVGLARAYALALLGFRPSEIPNLTWRAMTADGVENTSRKTQFEALQHVPPSLAAVFEGERTAVTIATNKRGRPFPSENALYKASGDYLRGLAEDETVAAGLTIKGLNHTLGSALAERGVDLRAARDAMQKRTLSTALHYSRRADTRRHAKSALGELESWLSLENIQPKVGKHQKSKTENT